MSYGFDFHRFDINKFDEQVFTYNEEELQVLEEVYKKTLKKLIDDGVTVTESLVIVLHKHLESQAMVLLDRIISDVNKAGTDGEEVADSFAMSLQKTIEHNEALIDEFAHSFIKRIPEAELLQEVTEKTTKKVVQDGVSLTDSIRADIYNLISSKALDLLDALGAIDIERPEHDVEAVHEVVSRSFKTGKSDEVESVADKLSKTIISQVPIEDTQTSDKFKIDAVKRNYEALSIDESTEFTAKTGFDDEVDDISDEVFIDTKLDKQDQVEWSDSIIFDLMMRTHEIIEVTEEFKRKFSRGVMSDVYELGDDYVMNIGKHHNEEYSAVDRIRKDISKVHHTVQNIGDQIQTRFVDYGAIVYVNGLKIRVLEGLVIRDSSNDRVSTCSFELVNVEKWVMDALHIMAEVHVMLFDGNKTEHFGGRIVANPVSWRGHAPTMRVEVEDFTATANDFIVNQTYENMYVHELIQAMWDEFYDGEIEYDIEESDKRIPDASFYFETLFDATEIIAEQVGWSWFIDWDGSKKTLRFFSPETNVYPERIGWGMKNVLEEGLEFGRDSEMFNALYFFGGEATSELLNEKNVSDGERYIYSFAYEPTDITILVDGVQQRIGIENIHNFDDDDVDCLVNYHEKALRFPEDSPPPEGAIVEKIYRYRYPIVVYIEDESSIERYGRIVREVREPKIADIGFAQERAALLLRENSEPKIYGRMNLRRVYGIRAGHIAEIYLPNIGVEGFFQIMEVEKTAFANRVNVTVSVNKIENPETEIAQRFKEIARRIRALEMDGVDENTVVHRYKQSFEHLVVAENVLIESRTAGVTFFDDARFNHADFA